MLVMLAEQIAEQTRIVKLNLVDADFLDSIGGLIFFVFHSHSPMS